MRSFADRSDARAPQAATVWQLQVMLGCAIIAPLLLFGVYTGIRITDAQLREVGMY